MKRFKKITGLVLLPIGIAMIGLALLLPENIIFQRMAELNIGTIDGEFHSLAWYISGAIMSVVGLLLLLGKKEN